MIILKLNTVMYIYGLDVESQKTCKGMPCILCLKMILNCNIDTLIISIENGIRIFSYNDLVSIYKKEMEYE